jgi:hypothetical protein
MSGHKNREREERREKREERREKRNFPVPVAQEGYAMTQTAPVPHCDDSKHEYRRQMMT